MIRKTTVLFLAFVALLVVVVYGQGNFSDVQDIEGSRSINISDVADIEFQDDSSQGSRSNGVDVVKDPQEDQTKEKEPAGPTTLSSVSSMDYGFGASLVILLSTIF